MLLTGLTNGQLCQFLHRQKALHWQPGSLKVRSSRLSKPRGQAVFGKTRAPRVKPLAKPNPADKGSSFSGKDPLETSRL